MYRVTCSLFFCTLLLSVNCGPPLRIDRSPVPRAHRTRSSDLAKPEEAQAPVANAAPAAEKPVVGVFDSPGLEQVEQAIRIFQLQRSKPTPAADSAWSPFLETVFAYLEQPAERTAFSPLIRARVAAEFELDADMRSESGADPELKKVVGILLSRIDTRMGEIRALRAGYEYNPPARSNGSFCWPLAYGLITSPFGLRQDPIDRSKTRFHAGVDLAASPNEPVHAVYGGVVTEAGWSGNWGRVVRIRHRGGQESIYAHLSTVLVKIDQSVTRGEVIGLLGRSGRTTGHHLHFGLYIEGEAVDPLKHLPEVPLNYSDSVPGVAFGYDD